MTDQQFRSLIRMLEAIRLAVLDFSHRAAFDSLARQALTVAEKVKDYKRELKSVSV